MSQHNVTLWLGPEMFEPAALMHKQGTCTIDAFNVGVDRYTPLGDVTWSVDVTNTSGSFVVIGTARIKAQVACSRCLERATYTLEGPIDMQFYVSDQDAKDNHDQEGDYFILPDDHHIDLNDAIEAALVYACPMMPLCKDDCAGLCPVCGCNRNKQTCTCDTTAQGAQGPFAVLKDFTPIK